VVDTYTVLDRSGCPASFTAQQTVLGSEDYTANPVVVTVEATQIIVTFHYSDFTVPIDDAPTMILVYELGTVLSLDRILGPYSRLQRR
jgi:hypothetical protein